MSERESDHSKDKYVACKKNENEIVGYLLHGQINKFAKAICYFLGFDGLSSFKIVLAGRTVNLGAGDVWHRIVTQGITYLFLSVKFYLYIVNSSY